MLTTGNFSRLVSLVLLATACRFRAEAAVFIVSNKNDSGSGSLRQAILDANNTPGKDTIIFNVAGPTPFNILPASALPPVTDPVSIDGTTQPNYTGTPLVGIVGSNAGSASGLVLQGGDSEVRGCAINRFLGSGVSLASSSNVVVGCYLGTSLAGTVPQANRGAGIMIAGANNRVGGTNANEGNLISGNQTGIWIVGLAATNNCVFGNFIGLDATGTGGLGNEANGLLISAPRNVIGGTTPAERNVISANGQSGIYLNGVGAMRNRILGNLVGTGTDGVQPLGNVADGVTISGAAQNVIGGAFPGSGNVISGNEGRGILIFGAGAVSNRVEGNLIGTDATGRGNLGNRFNGVGIMSASYNLIGGSNELSRNIIAGNQLSGVTVESNSIANVISGNFIGLDATGTNALPNGLSGISVLLGTNTTIGGTVPGAGNVISGNAQNGVLLIGGTGTLVQGNLIGTDATGRRSRANGYAGIQIQCSGNQVGGDSMMARNVVSGNANSGVLLAGVAASNNVVAGNFIGVDITGAAGLGNSYSGVGVTNAPRNRIGTEAPFGGNIISANASSGVYLSGSGATGNVLRGNLIGTDAAGIAALPNTVGGIFIYGAPANIIGGVEVGARNIVSGNLNVAIAIGDPGANGNVLLGNYIGTTADGNGALPNQWHGIELLNTASANVIGDTTPGAANRIAYAQTDGYDGVRVRSGCIANSIRGNAIFANGGASPNGLGIDRDADGVTTGSLVGFPMLTTGDEQYITTLSGMLSGIALTAYMIDFYGNSDVEPSGYGEGRRWIGTALVMTTGDGTASFHVGLTNAVAVGAYVSATLTDPAGNTSEFSATVPVPPSADADGDGIPDDYEIAFGLNPDSAADRDLDFDGDGASNYQEFGAGTRANDSGSHFRISLDRQNDRSIVSVETVAGENYRVEYAEEITGPWTAIAENLAGTGTALRVVDPGTEPKRFYRVRIN